jgi:gallate dioxygenase
MATIVGGIASSHTPTIGFALDTNKQQDPVWAPIFKGYEPVQRWLAEKAPDVLFFIFNDHVTSFFFDHYSHFALGVGEQYWVADEGGGPRKLPVIKGHPGLARHVATGLVADEFDMSYFQAKGLDHGCFSPLSLLWPHEKGWPGAIVPLQVGVLEFPIPSARRCYKLGRALRKAIESYPEDLKVAIVGTGGLSHQLTGPRFGRVTPDWDQEFMRLLAEEPEALCDYKHEDFIKLGGTESVEVINWLAMRGALPAEARPLVTAYYPHKIMGYGLQAFAVAQ